MTPEIRETGREKPFEKSEDHLFTSSQLMHEQPQYIYMIMRFCEYIVQLVSTCGRPVVLPPRWLVHVLYVRSEQRRVSRICHVLSDDGIVQCAAKLCWRLL